MLSYGVVQLRKVCFVAFPGFLLFGGMNNTAMAADYVINAGTGTVNCNALGVSPGDHIILNAGTRGNIKFSNCSGAPGKYINITNDTSGNGPTVIQSSASEFIFDCENCEYVTIDGTGKWSGAPAGSCGVTVSGGPWTLGRTQCGIKIEYRSGDPSNYIRLRGSSKNVTVKGVEIDGGFPNGDSRAPGVGIGLNDHQYLLADHPGEWREGFLFTQNYIHDTASECLYIGPNQTSGIGAGDLQLRNNHMSYNVLENCGYDGIELKSTIAGASTIHHNYVSGTGKNPDPASGNNGIGISLFEAGYTEVYNNYVRDTLSTPSGKNGPCYAANNQSLSKTDVATTPYSFYNNVAIDCKGKGINSARQGNSANSAPVSSIYNNTIVNANIGINAGDSGSDSSCSVRNNIVANSGGISANQCSTADNLVGTTASFNFADPASGDYHLTTNSRLALDAVSSGAPALDHDDIARVQGGAPDLGAFELNLGEALIRPNPPTMADL